MMCHCLKKMDPGSHRQIFFIFCYRKTNCEVFTITVRLLYCFRAAVQLATGSSSTISTLFKFDSRQTQRPVPTTTRRAEKKRVAPLISPNSASAALNRRERRNLQDYHIKLILAAPKMRTPTKHLESADIFHIV